MYDSLNQIIKEEKEKKTPFWKLVQLDDCHESETTVKESMAEVMRVYTAMKDSVINYDSSLKSQSGLVGGNGEKIRKRINKGQMICGDFIGSVIEKALKVSESNACMKRIVAAPTAGSCGVVPAVLISLQEKEGFSDDKMCEALYVAAGIGGVIASKASISGAQHGCQAEIGAASSMAAGAAVYLYGGDGNDIANAAALALKNLLGLACDPVAGLVEVPCVKRNVMGAVNAITSADLTLAGIKSKIPADEVFEAMNKIGRNMNADIKETAEGGLAATKTGNRIKESIKIK